MLVLSRKPRQRIVMRHRETRELIELSVVEIRSNSARIGIDAGKQWQIIREELIARDDVKAA